MSKNQTKEQPLTRNIKSGNKFYFITSVTNERHEYQVKAITKSNYNANGVKMEVTNVTATRLDTDKDVVFNLDHLLGMQAKLI